MNPKVSIITATYNSAEFIEALFVCLLNQTYKNWEWLITDDCSKDNTWALLEKIAAQDARVCIKKNIINQGAAVSRNESLSRATGEYLAFVDSDDLWHPEKLSKQISFMLENQYNFTFTAYRLINEQGIVLNKEIDLRNKRTSFSYSDMLCKRATLGCSTVVVQKDIISDMTMPLLRTGQDYAFWLKILKQQKTAHLLQECLTDYRIVQNSISRNKFKKAARQWQIYRDVEKLNFVETVYSFINYAYRAVFRG
ncbi:glycosyltransferase family 2 protein [Winslowiella toletana]|uniref:glycosyltransferase family 2 protein n=1 Tax=Winslowiella toletana TaxID=92490 RepID=UPI0028BD54E8|nr:glycosyltransferase family 2 protein [Winslowiella toletana]WNN42968.1 glycosyltransferase family 2 protein [Winslowiella toletana]